LLKRIRPLGQWVNSAADFVESRPLTAAAAIFALAFTIRLLFLFGTSTWPDEKNYEMTRVAMSVAAGEGYSNPFAPARTGPSAHIAPAYATVLAGVYRVFGTGQTGDLVKQLLSCVISSLVYALLPAIAVAAGLARHIGFFAGLLGALAPVSIEVEVIGRWEAHFSTLLFVLAVWLWFRHFRSGEFSFRSGAFAGVVWGVLLLTAPAFVLVLSSLVLLLMAQRKYRTRRVAAYVASLALVLILVITPWTIRNVRQFGTMFFIRNNAGLEFYVSNLPGAKLMLHDNMLGIGKSVHPFTEPAVCQRVAEIGELAFNRECMANFKEIVRTDTGRFAFLSFRRFIWMWLPMSEHPIRDSILPRDLLLCAISIFGLIGLYVLPRDLGFARSTFATILLSYPLVYYFVQSATRYRFPIVWITCLLAAYAVLQFVTERSGFLVRHDRSQDSKSQSLPLSRVVSTAAPSEEGMQDG
jgi:hypothetical protein